MEDSAVLLPGKTTRSWAHCSGSVLMTALAHLLEVNIGGKEPRERKKSLLWFSLYPPALPCWTESFLRSTPATMFLTFLLEHP